jgi:Ca2+-binding RTX toxin-like protein
MMTEAFVHRTGTLDERGTTRRLRLVGGAIIAIIALGAASAGPAWSATAEQVGDRLSYRAGAGEANDLVVRGSNPGTVFHDAGATIQAGVGCSALADGGVECGSGLSWENVPPRIEIRLGDRNDRATSEIEGPVEQEIEIAGGPGSDTLHSGSGTGNTHLLSGGPGNDHLIAMTNNTGDATFIGGPGDDVLENLEGGRASFYGGPGADEVEVGGRGGIRVISGGPGADRYSAGFFEETSAVVRAILPSPGTDTLSAATTDGPLTIDLVDCGGCVENVIGSPHDDTILGNGAANVLLGGEGSDLLNPRGGVDRVAGQDGDDQIELRDGWLDRASCGEGLDQVGADANPVDAVALDCEQVVQGG